ncbi:MAG: HD domain-containing protein [Bacteroidetes bacterium]|nr:MAG: HD domain-containing protein [Bacteroidota bacterium]
MENHVQLSKIINDPVHGFIEINNPKLLQIIDNQLFQRLRRIKQLGLGSLVYPGATHTRFSHALGAMHLTRQAMDVLRNKQVDITPEEYEATLMAILLHDVGHGPFSHALEHALIPNLRHEQMSLAFMQALNQQMEGALELAIAIFEDRYPKKFLHQLVSSQLDMDRMDYLIRDSFFTGVAEGIVGIDRIIKTLNVFEGQLVCESKAIYSVEKFVVARRLMYWQVYLHKAAVAAECMLLSILRRARELVHRQQPLYLDENLAFFFHHNISSEQLGEEVMSRYLQLDDNDVEFHLKKWVGHPDRVLAELCERLLRRRLLKVRMKKRPFRPKKLELYLKRYMKLKGYTAEEAAYFVFSGTVSNQAYLKESEEPILILTKEGRLRELPNESDMKNISALSKMVVKSYLCFPGEIRAAGES